MATLFIGQNVIFLPTVDSTNSYASTLLKNVNTPEGAVVHTHHQTQGRGQRGNSWNSEPASNVTLSVILKPGFLSVKSSFLLSKITALALHDVLAEMFSPGQFDIKIKWPNDILLNSKKIAGILIENSFKESNVMNSVIGIGLNVNQRQFDDISNATSLNLTFNKNFDLQPIMALIFSHLEKWYLALRKGAYDAIDNAYLQHLFKLNELCSFEAGGQTLKAFVKGVNTYGHLILETQEGEKKEFEMKAVKMIY